MGWVWLVLIGLGAFGLLLAAGVPRALSMIVGAALLLGGAGYALQQNAALPGHSVRTDARGIEVDPGMVLFRTAIMPGVGDDAAVLAAADEQMRRGETQAAIDALLAAVDRQPDRAALWTGLGSALVAHDNGQLSPAAELAFRRALRLAPAEPGPPFFLGMAQVQSGDLAAAKRAWLLALSLTPRDALYRISIAERLVMIDQFLAMHAAQGMNAEP